MTISSFIIRIIFLALPGIIGTLLYRTLKGKPSNKDWEDVLEIAIFSLLGYVVAGSVMLLLKSGGFSIGNLTAIQAFYDDKIPIPLDEIAFACIIGIFLAFIATYLHTYKVIIRLGRALKATRRYGDEDVWEGIHNRSDVDWVVVKDHKLDLNYSCCISQYSDTEKPRELLLEDVDVYSNSTGELIYTTKLIYISRERDDITIETPPSSEQPSSNQQQETTMDKQEKQLPRIGDGRTPVKPPDTSILKPRPVRPKPSIKPVPAKQPGVKKGTNE